MRRVEELARSVTVELVPAVKEEVTTLPRLPACAGSSCVLASDRRRVGHARVGEKTHEGLLAHTSRKVEGGVGAEWG